MTSLAIHFGALCDTPSEQVKEQVGIEIPDYFDKLAFGLTLAAIHGVLPDGQIHKARQKLLNKIAKWVGDNPKEFEKMSGGD